MLKNILIGCIVLVLLGIGAWFISYSPFFTKPSVSMLPDSKNAANNAQAGSPTPSGPKAVAAILAYAAKQLSVPQSKLTIVSSTEKEWPDSCLGTLKDAKACKQVVTRGYEVILQLDGKNFTYRADNQATSVRFVKN